VPAQGDLNGDGSVDLAVPQLGSNDIRVLLGNKNGTFRAPSGVSVILGEGSVKFGDMIWLLHFRSQLQTAKENSP